MEQRIYFLAGDVLSNIVIGIVAAWFAGWLVEPSWFMPAGMLVGMLAGMGLGVVLMPILVGLFGAMEVMLPVMLTAMLAGMVFGMVGTMQTIPFALVLAGGGAIGMLVLSLIYMVDAFLRGRVL